MAPWRFFPAPGQRRALTSSSRRCRILLNFLLCLFKSNLINWYLPKKPQISYQMIVSLPVCQLCYGFFLQLFGGNHFNEIVGNKYLVIASSWPKRTCFKNPLAKGKTSTSLLLYPLPKLLNWNLHGRGLIGVLFLKAPQWLGFWCTARVKSIKSLGIIKAACAVQNKSLAATSFCLGTRLCHPKS